MRDALSATWGAGLLYHKSCKKIMSSFSQTVQLYEISFQILSLFRFITI